MKQSRKTKPAAKNNDCMKASVVDKVDRFYWKQIGEGDDGRVTNPSKSIEVVVAQKRSSDKEAKKKL
jgi:hypothetical protein